MAKLRREDTIKREALERKNRELDSLHYVWCDGGCGGGVHRYDDKGPDGLTEDVVKTAIRNVNRMVGYFNNREFKHLDQVNEDGVRNRFKYIYGLSAIEKAKSIAENQGPIAAWGYIEQCLRDRQL